MDVNKKKELFSKAFVSALAAQSGLRSSVPDVDDDSVDVTIQGRGLNLNGIRSPKIDVQLKCTDEDSGDDSIFKFKLKIKNYEDLRGDNFLCPRFLFVLVVPENTSEWLTHQPSFTELKHYGYWFSLRDMGPVYNKTSVTIAIPRTQRLTSQSLLALMDSANNGACA
jgi:hypothetical protein